MNNEISFGGCERVETRGNVSYSHPVVDREYINLLRKLVVCLGVGFNIRHNSLGHAAKSHPTSHESLHRQHPL